MMTAEITGPWTTNTDDENVPLISEVWRDAGFVWRNLSQAAGQGGSQVVPEPNLSTWTVDVVHEDAIALLESDDRFEVLWSEPV